LGQRADSGVLLDKEKKCIVEGSFLVSGNLAVKSFLTENELDADEDIFAQAGDFGEWKIKEFYQRHTCKSFAIKGTGCFAG
jgi:DNA repair protein RecN (Recombination protein N)